jgi:hypothetical protein
MSKQAGPFFAALALVVGDLSAFLALAGESPPAGPSGARPESGDPIPEFVREDKEVSARAQGACARSTSGRGFRAKAG